MKRRIIVLTLVTLLMGTFPTGSMAAPPSSECALCGCGDVIAKFEWTGDEVSGTYTGFGQQFVTLTVTDRNNVSWTSTVFICCVIVKAAQSYGIYPITYPGGTSGTVTNAGLTVPSGGQLAGISHITFCGNGGDVAVTLSSFSGTAEDGLVTLNWTTGSETENMGYHVLRSLSEDGTYERITTSLIEGAGSSRTTREYRFVDEDVQAGVTYFYKLQDVDFAGATNMYGPIQVTLEKPSIQKSTWGKIKTLLSMLVSPLVPKAA
jgi:hypothetical protein